MFAAYLKQKYMESAAVGPTKCEFCGIIFTPQ